MADESSVRVIALGSAASALGWEACDLPLSGPTRLEEIVQRLERDCARLAQARERMRYAVNERYATLDTPVRPGDEVAVIPPVSGGDHDAPPIAARLTREPIDLAALTRAVEDAGIGAIATFVGVVRAERDADGRPLAALEYSAHESMALAELERLCADALERFEVHGIQVAHRLGRLEIGAASVAIVVSAPHRAAALDACRALIEQLKAAVPIFKKELWQGGPDHWVDGI